MEHRHGVGAAGDGYKVRVVFLDADITNESILEAMGEHPHEALLANIVHLVLVLSRLFLTLIARVLDLHDFCHFIFSKTVIKYVFLSCTFLHLAAFISFGTRRRS